MHHDRIMILGSPGSGKTTLALQLHDILGLPLYHLDRYFRVKNDDETDIEKVRKEMKKIVANPKWIIDGNYNRTIPIRLKRADLIIYMRFPTDVCMKRAEERFESTKGQQRFDAPEGMIDTELDPTFMNYISTFSKTYDKHYVKMITESGKDYIVLDNDEEVRNFIESVRAGNE